MFLNPPQGPRALNEQIGSGDENVPPDQDFGIQKLNREDSFVRGTRKRAWAPASPLIIERTNSNSTILLDDVSTPFTPHRNVPSFVTTERQYALSSVPTVDWRTVSNLDDEEAELIPSFRRQDEAEDSTKTAVWSQEQYIATQELDGRLGFDASLQDRSLDEDDILSSTTPSNQLHCSMGSASCEMLSQLMQSSQPRPQSIFPIHTTVDPAIYMTPQISKKELDLRSLLDEELDRVNPTARRLPPVGITQLTQSLFIGGFPSEDTLQTLRNVHGVTHLVNVCSRDRKYAHSSCARTSFRSALEIEARDELDYYIISHDLDVFSVFLDTAMESGGKVFVHCVAGVNRSVTLCMAYLIQRHHFGVMEVVEHFRKNGKHHLLDNRSFRRQLVEFALTQSHSGRAVSHFNEDQCA